MSPLGEYIHCQRCGDSFNMEMLNLDPTAMGTNLEPGLCPNCKNMNPGENPACLRCQRWLCASCGHDNPPEGTECLRCRDARGFPMGTKS